MQVRVEQNALDPLRRCHVPSCSPTRRKFRDGCSPSEPAAQLLAPQTAALCSEPTSCFRPNCAHEWRVMSKGVGRPSNNTGSFAGAKRIEPRACAPAELCKSEIISKPSGFCPTRACSGASRPKTVSGPAHPSFSLAPASRRPAERRCSPRWHQKVHHIRCVLASHTLMQSAHVHVD